MNCYRRLLFLSIICFSCVTTQAQELPEIFSHTTVGKAYRASKLGGKLVFAFVYTDWSVPSLKMMDTTFQDQKVVKELLADYEPVGINAVRKKSFVEEYKVHIFPTYLIMDHNGDVVLRAKGHKTPEELLATLAKTRSNSRYLKETLTNISNQATRENILELIDSVRYYKDDFEARNLAKKYLDKKSTDWRDPVSMYLIKENFGLDKDYLKFLSKYHFKFFERFDSLEIKENIAFHVFLNSMKTNSRGRPEFNFKPVKKWFRKHRISGVEKLENFVKIKYLLWGRGPSIRYSVNLLKHYPETSNDNVMYASVIRLILSNSRRNIDYNDLIYSVKNSIKEDGTFWRYDLLSLLYYKIGNEIKADQAIEAATQIAEVLGEEYEPTLPLIADVINTN